jgi:hypothetical protein
MKFINCALALLIVKSNCAFAKLSGSKDRNLQFDNVFGAVANATGINATALEGIDLNSTEGLTTEQLEGIFGMNYTDMMGGGMPEGAVPFDLNSTIDGLVNATTDFMSGLNLTGIDLNSTEGLTTEQLEGIFGSNFTDMMGGLPEGMTMPTGFGMMPTMPMACPDTCPAELCPAALAGEDVVPDEQVVADSCDAGTINTCFSSMEMVCGSLCGEEALDLSALGIDLASLGLDEGKLESQCHFCKLLECCDGTNTYADSCSAHASALLEGGLIGATGTGAATTTEGEDTEAATTTDGEDTEHDDEDGHDHDEEEDTDVEDALEGDDSAANGQLISTVASIVSVGLLINAL